jgi:hypothetical protein
VYGVEIFEAQLAAEGENNFQRTTPTFIYYYGSETEGGSGGVTGRGGEFPGRCSGSG